jgi:tetratricopeptide (TPR) repeat protein
MNMDGLTVLQGKIARFESFLQDDPHNPDLLRELGELLHRAGQFDSALACFERLRALTPDTGHADSRIASVYLSQQRFHEAAIILADLTSREPDNPALHFNLGLAQYFQHQFAAACDSIRSAQAAGLHSSDAWKYLCHSLHQEGQLDEAIAACEQWLATAADTESRGYLALLAWDAGQRERALELANSVLTIQPENIDANAVIGAAALEQQDMPKASHCFQQILAKQPDHGRAWLGLGLGYLHEQQNTRAVDAISEATRQMPTHAGTMVTLGWANIIAHNAIAAETAFRHAIELDRNFAESHGGLAVALAHLKRFEEAAKVIKTADRINPANFGSIYAKALLLQAQGKPEAAQNLINMALTRSPAEGASPLIEHIRKYLAVRPQSLPE